MRFTLGTEACLHKLQLRIRSLLEASVSKNGRRVNYIDLFWGTTIDYFGTKQ
jgi:hypothetical protein